MPNTDFSRVGNAQDFSPLPPGAYPCRLAEIDPNGLTKAGDEMWNLQFVVSEGDCQGRMIFDRISFGEAALPRVKLLCEALGLDVSGEVDLEPELLEGREAIVTVDIQTYFDQGGNEKKSNKVTFTGYSHINGKGPSSGPGATGDGLPF